MGVGVEVAMREVSAEGWRIGAGAAEAMACMGSVVRWVVILR